MKVRWLPRASNSLRRIRNHITLENQIAAKRVARLVIESAKRLAEFPESGRQGRIEETRELIIVGYPCIVVYRLREQDVEIIEVIHTSHQWPAKIN